VRSCLIYGSETWLMKMEHEIYLKIRRCRIERTVGIGTGD